MRVTNVLIVGMRRLTIASFALFYGALILLGSVQRATLWASSESHFVKQAGKPEVSGSSGLRHHAPHNPQTRVLEDEFVVEPPKPDSPTSLPFGRNSMQWRVVVVRSSTIAQIPSRAPPSVV